MKNKFYYALKDIKRNIHSIIVFVGQLTICAYFIVYCLISLNSNLQYGNQIKKLMDYNLTTFNVYYDIEGVRLTTDMSKMLIDLLDNKQNAFSVVENIQLPKYDTNVVVGVGKFGQLFNLIDEGDIKDNHTKAYIGAKVSEVQVGEDINFGLNGDVKLSVDGRLAKDVSYLRKQNTVNLDHSIVILTSFEEFSKIYYNYYTEPIITNIGLINPTDDEVRRFIKTIADSGTLNLSPRIFNSNADVTYKNIMQNINFFLLFFLSTTVFIIVGIICNLLLLIDSNLQEYAIHRLYGATLKDLYWRTVIYIMGFVVVPLVVIRKIISFRLYISPMIMFLIASVVIVLLAIIPFQKLKKQDLTFYLRRDY